MNIGEMLGAMVQSGMSASSSDRMRNALGGDALDNLTHRTGSSSEQAAGGGISEIISSALGGGRGSGGGIGDILTGMLGDGQRGSGTIGASGGIGDLLSGMLGDVGRSVGGNRNLAVGGLGALIGSLLGGGGKSMGGALGGGMMALLGMLAFNALKGSGQQKAVIPVGLLEPQTTEEQAQLERNSELVLKAMINAIKSDGKVDHEELERMMDKFSEIGVDEEGRHYLMSQLRQPMETDALIEAAKDQPDLAAQIYAASLMAIEVDTQAEKNYLARLASGLGLEPQVTGHIRKMVGLP